MLLPVLRVMKPVVEHYRFLAVHHQDSLWKRHRFESQESINNDARPEPLELLLNQRKSTGYTICARTVANSSLPQRTYRSRTPFQRAIVLIENRIDRQWLFTVLNMADVSKGQRIYNNCR